MTLRKLAEGYQDRMRAVRRDLHRQPEIGLHLPHTQQRVLDELADLPFEISCGTSCSSVTAILRGGRRSSGAPVVLLRADMDALAVTEESGVPYASQIPGTMHACGHDLHTAMLTGAARVLTDQRDELPGDVVLMFQPGEEMHDGAAHMINEGILDAAGRRADAAYAIHVMASRFAQGIVLTREGPMMAAADGFSVVIEGRGGHSSAPHHAVDPVTIAAECVLALQSYVTRRVDVFDPVVVGIGHLAAGDAKSPNAIPQHARFDASVRFWSQEARSRFHRQAAELVTSIATGHGARAEITHVKGYPTTINNTAEAQFALGIAGELFGADRVINLPHPLSASEDFSRVLEQVPGAFICIGAAPAGDDPSALPDNHSPYAVFDDAVLADGAVLYASLAIERLSQLAAP